MNKEDYEKMIIFVSVGLFITLVDMIILIGVVK